MRESTWAQVLTEDCIDLDHHDAILCDEFLNISRTFGPVLDDEASAARIQEIESDRGIVWGDTLRAPLTGSEVLRAFALIDAGLDPDGDGVIVIDFRPEALDYDLVGGY